MGPVLDSDTSSIGAYHSNLHERSPFEEHTYLSHSSKTPLDLEAADSAPREKEHLLGQSKGARDTADEELNDIQRQHKIPGNTARDLDVGEDKLPVHTSRNSDVRWVDDDTSGGEQEALLADGPVRTEGAGHTEGAVHSGRHSDVRWSKDSDWTEADGNVWATKQQVSTEVLKQSALAGPIMGMNVVWFLRSIVSMVFLGHLGELELAAGSLAISLANVTGYSILYGLSTGLEPLISQAYGAKRYHTMGRILNRGIVILLVACIPIALVWINAERLLILMKQDREIAREAGRYLLFMLPDLVALAGAQPVRVYLRSQGLTFPLIPCAVIAFTFHVPINFLLIYGFKMGAVGAALAASVTDFNLLFLMVLYIRCMGVHKKSWTGFSLRACFTEWGPFLRLAAPSCVATCLEWWCYELSLLFAGLLENPVESVAVMSVCLNFGALAYMVPAAQSAALSARVGNELGANNPFLARLATQVAGVLSVVLGCVCAIVLVLTRNEIGGLFTDNKDLLGAIAAILPLVALCHVADSPQTTLSGALRGMARPTICLIVNLASYYAVGMPVALFLAFYARLGVPGMWMGLFCAQVVQLVLIVTIIHWTNWPLQAYKAQELTKEHDTEEDSDSKHGFDFEKGFEMADVEKQDIADVYGLDDEL